MTKGMESSHKKRDEKAGMFNLRKVTDKRGGDNCMPDNE